MRVGTTMFFRGRLVSNSKNFFKPKLEKVRGSPSFFKLYSLLEKKVFF